MTVRIALALALVTLLAGCLSSGNLPLRFVSGDDPVYPQEAHDKGIEGHVTVVYDITVEGRVENPRVVESEPPGVFDQAALAAVSAWKFAAPVVNGVPEAVRDRRSRVDFTLGDEDDFDKYEH